jgi:hypothetical protein
LNCHLQKELGIKFSTNVEPRAHSGQRDPQGRAVKKQRRTKAAGGISEYIKMLKKADVYPDYA